MIKTLMVGIVLGCSLAAPSFAEEYPKGPIKVIVPFNPGGGSDRQARLVEKLWEKEFTQPLVYVYRTGAGGAIGASVIASAKNDGYTIGVHTFPTLVMYPLTSDATFDMGSFDFLAQSTSEIQMLLVRKDSQFKTIEQMIDFAKKKPGRITIGIVTNYGPEHIDVLKLMKQASIKMTIVPLGGGARGLAALLGNHVDALMGYESAVQGEIKKMRILAVSTAKRSKNYPEAPTFVEKGYEIVSSAARIWVAPAGLPVGVRARLIDGLASIFANPEIRDQAARIKQPVIYKSGDAVAKMVADYAKKAKKIIANQNIKPK